MLLVEITKDVHKDLRLLEEECIFETQFDDYNSQVIVKDPLENYFERELFEIRDLLKNFNIINQKAFFKELNVQTPHVLNKTNSLKRTNNTTDLMKFAVRLSRSGFKTRSVKMISEALFQVFSEIKIKFSPIYSFIDIKNLFYFYTIYYSNTNSAFNIEENDIINLNHDHLIKSSYLIKSEDMLPDSFIKASFKKFNLLFSFYIYKVDKNIYKNSRGRSGKFTFVWKYIAPYKRKSLIAHWLMKEVKVSPGRKLIERVYFILNKFLCSPKDTLAWKVNRFSLNYVYYYLRKSLGESCRTVMK